MVERLQLGPAQPRKVLDMSSWTLDLRVHTASVEESLRQLRGLAPWGRGWCHPCLRDLFVVGVC